MGKPMKSRILSIVLAMSMIAGLVAALPTRGAVDYTGTVITTDDSGIPKTEFIQGEDVYVNVTTWSFGVLSVEQVTVTLARTNDGHVASSFTTNTNNPVVGVYNSTLAASHLHLATTHAITGDVQSYDVIVTEPIHGVEIARIQITVRATGLNLSPEPNQPAYWPGEVITITLVVTEAQTAEVFYVEVVNETGVPTTVNFTDQTALTGYWTDRFSIGATLPDGIYFVNVKGKSDNLLWYDDSGNPYSVSFEVMAYAVIVNTDRTYYLPGETAKISYSVISLASLTQLTSGVDITYSVEYLNKTGNVTWKNGTLSAAENLWSFTLPTNGTASDSIGLFSDLDVTVTAKQAAGNREVSEGLTLHIGLLSATVDMADHSLAPGDTAEVTVTASVSFSSLPGARAVVTVMRNGTLVETAYGNGNLTTNMDGQAGYSFVLSSSAPEGNYIVKAVVSKLGYSVTRETQFSVNPRSDLLVSWDKLYYYAGQEATVSFQPILNGQVASVTAIGYMIQIEGQILAMANTTAMSVTVTIPDGYAGFISCMAFTQINGEIVENGASANVVYLELGLTSTASTYRPGETIVFEWSLVTAVASANMAYEIIDEFGVRVATGNPEFAMTGSFEFDVPDANPLISDSYTATLRVTTSTGGFASATASVDIVADEELLVWVGDSPYATGEYAPGQKVKIHYEIASYMFTSRPLIRLHVSVSFDPIEFDYVTDAAKGTFTYVIPDNAPNAQLYVYVEAFDAATGDSISTDMTAFVVNNRVSGWDRSIGGMSAIDFVLLVLLVIVIVMLILVPWLKGRMGAPKPPEPAPPADAGKLPPP